jgi:hypothetical protein
MNQKIWLLVLFSHKRLALPGAKKIWLLQQLRRDIFRWLVGKKTVGRES